MSEVRPEDLFNDALDLRAADRSMFLDHACGSDLVLRAEVERMLGVHDQFPEFLAVPATPSSPQAVIAESPAPKMIGPYRIVGELGRGGMGIVYLGLDPNLLRQVAIKVLPEPVAQDPSRRAQLAHEARVLAALQQPNITTVYSLEESEERAFLTMEVAPGQTLTERLRTQRPTLFESLSIWRQVAQALEAAHEQGIIHKDIKPANIMISDDGLVKVLDFGLAETAPPTENASTQTPFPLVQGTPGYMSPEQVRGGALDPRTDLWSLACVLYECLTGRQAVGGKTAAETLEATLRRDPDWALLPAELSVEIEAMLKSCLSRSVSERPATAGVVRKVLEVEAARSTLDAFGQSSAAPDSTVPNNVPHPISSFVGRGAAIRGVEEALVKSRLVTISGAGGIGKTRLTLEVARRRVDRDHLVTWFVPLNEVTSSSLVAGHIVRVLGLSATTADPLKTLSAFLDEHKALLVLDNCERLLPGCTQIAQQILSTRDTRLLLTSREALGLEEEAVYAVCPLTMPPKTNTISLKTLRSFESAQLFLDRVPAGSNLTENSDADTTAIAAICRRLEGIPLALELAASRMRVLSAPDLALRLDQRLDLLGSKDPGRAPHHRTLRALIEWSYDTLDGREQSLFRRLSIFAGGWSLEAMAEVCSDEGLENWRLLDLLTSLMTKSLVEIDYESSRAVDEPRYRMLETIRQYGWERVAGTGLHELRHRHRDYYLRLAEDAELQMKKGDQERWLRRLAVDDANLRRALDTCFTFDAHSDIGLRLCVALGGYWLLRGDRREALQYYETALASTVPAPVLRARALISAGNECRHQHDLERAAGFYQSALETARELPDPRICARALTNLGAVLRMRRDFAQARAHLEEALSIYRAQQDVIGTGRALTNLGTVASSQADYPAALEYFEESLSIQRAARNRGDEALALNNLGSVASKMGMLHRAEICFAASLGIRRELGDRRGAAISLHNLGDVLRISGDLNGAEASFQESLAHSRELADHVEQAWTLHGLAEVAMAREDWPLARQRLEESARLAAGNEDEESILASTQTDLAKVALAEGDHERSQRLLEDGLRRHVSLDDRPGIARGLEVLALLAANTDRSLLAARRLGAADAIRHEIAAPLSNVEEQALWQTIIRARGSVAISDLEQERSLGARLPWREIAHRSLPDGTS